MKNHDTTESKDIRNAVTGETIYSAAILIRRWEVWLLSALFGGLIWFAIEDRARIVAQVELTRNRQVINEERITRLETGDDSLRENQREIKATLDRLNDKLDVLLERAGGTQSSRRTR